MTIPFYKKCEQTFQKIQNLQIQKGLEKYNRPLDPTNFSIRDLVLHALEENIDQLHYLVAILEKTEEQDEQYLLGKLAITPFKPKYFDLDDE